MSLGGEILSSFIWKIILFDYYDYGWVTHKRGTGGGHFEQQQLLTSYFSLPGEDKLVRVDVEQLVGELQSHCPSLQSGSVGIGRRYWLDTEGEFFCQKKESRILLFSSLNHSLFVKAAAVVAMWYLDRLLLMLSLVYLVSLSSSCD